MARERRSNSKSAAADRRRPQKKKISILNTEQVAWIDYKDVNLLRRFMSDRGKIRARRVSGNCAQHQRDVAVAIKTARELVLLPYTQRTVAERTGPRVRRDSGPRADVEAPTSDVDDLDGDDGDVDEIDGDGDSFGAAGPEVGDSVSGNGDGDGSGDELEPAVSESE